MVKIVDVIEMKKVNELVNAYNTIKKLEKEIVKEVKNENNNN